MAWFVRILIFAIVSPVDVRVTILRSMCFQGIVSWPVAKFMEIILGPHHGIMYRRAGT